MTESLAARIQALADLAQRSGRDPSAILQTADPQESKAALLAGLIGIDARLALNLNVPLPVALGAEENK